MIDSYRTRLKAMIDSTITRESHKGTHQRVATMFYEAVIKLNEDTLQQQVELHKDSGITYTPAGTLKQAQAVMGVEREEA